MTDEPQPTSAVYDKGFFDELNAAGAASASVVLPLVVDLLSPRSAIDVGCGTGVWATELLRLGIEDVVGVDGAYVPHEQRVLPPERFTERDLTRPLQVGRRFDVALCLEVAEHLASEHADHLVAQLVGLAPAVIFSAATPLQGGVDHVNEQWPDYWISRFESHGYTCWDVLRPRVRYEREVAWIYRQNLLVMLGPDHSMLERLDPTARVRPPADGDVSFEFVARYLLERESGLRETVARIPRLARARLRRFRS